MKPDSLELAMQKFVNWGDSVDLSLDSYITDLPLMQRLKILTMKPRDLYGFIELTNSIRYHCVPNPENFNVSMSKSV